MTVHGDRRQDRQARIQQCQPDDWDRDRTDEQVLLHLLVVACQLTAGLILLHWH